MRQVVLVPVSLTCPVLNRQRKGTDSAESPRIYSGIKKRTDLFSRRREAGINKSVPFFPWQDKTTEKTRNTQQTAAASQLEAGLNLDVKAGRDIVQQGSDMTAGYDLAMQAGRDIRIDAAHEQETTSVEKTHTRNGLTATMNHNLGNTLDAIQGAGKGDNAVSQGSSVLKAADSISQFVSGPTFDGHLGNSSQSSTVTHAAIDSRASTLDAGNDIRLVANNDVAVNGSLLQSGRDINVKGRDVIFGATKGEYAVEQKGDRFIFQPCS